MKILITPQVMDDMKIWITPQVMTDMLAPKDARIAELEAERDRLTATLGQVIMAVLQHDWITAEELACNVEIGMVDGAPVATVRGEPVE